MMKAHILKTWALAGILGLSASQCVGSEFTVEGTVFMKGYRNGELEGATNYHFKVEARDCSVRIRVFGGRFSSTEYHEYGWDTTNSHMFIKLRGDRVTKVVRYFENGEYKTKELDKPVKPANDGTLTIGLDILPENGRGIEPVWLAYAGGCYYKALSPGKKMRPVWWMGGGVREADILFVSDWQLNQSFPQLLDYFADFTDGKRYEIGGDKPVPTRMPKPFDQPTTNSVYRVLAWTNVAGMALPLRFQVVRYGPDAPSSTSQPRLVPLESYEGTATSIQPVCAVSDFGPIVSGAVPTQIVDQRLTSELAPVRGIAYFSLTGKVASVEDLRDSKLYKQALETKRALESAEPQKSSRKARLILIIVMMITASVPVWILSRVKSKTK